MEVVQVSGCVWGTRIFAIIAVPVVPVSFCIVSKLSRCAEVVHTVGSQIRACGWRWSLGWRGIDHELEALLGRRKLGDVMLWMGSSYVLLHRTISLFLPPKISVTMVVQETKRAELYEGCSRHSRAGHSRRGNVCDSWSHLGCAMDTQLHCWRPKQRTTMSTMSVEASFSLGFPT